MFCDTCGREVIWFDAHRTGVWLCTAANWGELGIAPPRSKYTEPGTTGKTDGTPRPSVGDGPGGC